MYKCKYLLVVFFIIQIFNIVTVCKLIRFTLYNFRVEDNWDSAFAFTGSTNAWQGPFEDFIYTVTLYFTYEIIELW